MNEPILDYSVFPKYNPGSLWQIDIELLKKSNLNVLGKARTLGRMTRAIKNLVLKDGISTDKVYAFGYSRFNNIFDCILQCYYKLWEYESIKQFDREYKLKKLLNEI